MTTNTDPYCQIHGYDFSSIIYAEGVSPGGGSHGIEEITSPARNYADVRSKGRAPKTYKIKARSTDRDEIEAFLYEVNNAPEDAFFYPFESERSGRIASAYAAIEPIQYGAGHNFYEATAQITAREAWLYGPDRGTTGLQWFVPLNWYSAGITNNGHMKAPINYMQCGGDQIDEYVEDLSVRITRDGNEQDRKLILCDKLMRGDVFELGWRGEVQHSFDARFSSLSRLSLDVQGLTSGGSVDSAMLTLDNSDYVMMPFQGPLPASGEPSGAYIELIVNTLTGDGAHIYKAFETDLSDMAEVNHDDLIIGENVVYIPGVEGKGFVAIGVKAAASGSVTISKMKGSIKRYVATSRVPYIDVGESGVIRVEASAGQQLRFLQVCMPDRFWY